MIKFLLAAGFTCLVIAIICICFIIAGGNDEYWR